MTNNFMLRRQLVAFDGATEQLVGYIDERCGGVEDHIQPSVTFLFDSHAGRLLIFDLRSFDVPPSGTPTYSVPWVAVLSGFPSTFDILQTYTPATNEIGFRVPHMPEGLPAADWFDTYYGPLTQPIDFTQAQPLQCGYPASAPGVGDYLTVADPLPNPAPGEGRYYVTAVTHQGQRRYGRQNIGGVMSGRNPALLPQCR